MDYKLIYLARRNPAIAREEFPQAWRNHSRLASSFATTLGSNFRSVRQCIKIWGAALPASFANDHDGAALLAMKGFEEMQAARVHPRSLDEMKKDEETTFADHVANWTMPCEEYVIFDKGDGEAGVISFLARRPEIEDASLTERLQRACNQLADIAAARAHGTRLTLNRVIELRDPPYDFAAIIELWFDSLANAEQALRDADLVAALEQSKLADPARGVRLFARTNYEKTTIIGADGSTGWALQRDQ